MTLSQFGRTRLYEIKSSVSLLIILVGLFAARESLASPWIEAGDEQIRHHLETLADGGHISTPINSWPAMWSNIKVDLDNINPSDLSDGELWSYRFLKHELRKAMKPFALEQSISVGNRVSSIADFSTDSRERFQSSVSVVGTGDRLAYKAMASYIYHPADSRLDGEKEPPSHTYRFDGSYMNYLAGNWVAGVGFIDHWWGPGWETSLILSNNARPVPSLYFQRNLATPFETPLLSWIGAWQLTTFMGELESNSDIPNAKLWGMRVNIKPFNQFELGLSRTAQWGGDGRPNDIDTFIDLLLGRDNCDDYGNGQCEDALKEPGNQLAGIDWRWGDHFGDTRVGLYGQFVGEDEAGYMPSRSIGMAGVEIGLLLGEVHTRFNLEAQNTAVYFYDSNKRAEYENVAYEHGIYRNGYRFHGRPIGASTDNDSESLTLRGQFYFNNGHNLNLSIGHHRLNSDNTNLPRPGGSIFGSEERDTFKTQVTYTAPLTGTFRLKASLFNFSSQIEYGNIKIGTGGHIGVSAYY